MEPDHYICRFLKLSTLRLQLSKEFINKPKYILLKQKCYTCPLPKNTFASNKSWLTVTEQESTYCIKLWKTTTLRAVLISHQQMFRLYSYHHDVKSSYWYKNKHFNN